MYKLTYICPRCQIITDLATNDDMSTIEQVLDGIQASDTAMNSTCRICGRETSGINFSIVEIDPGELQPVSVTSPVVVAS